MNNYNNNNNNNNNNNSKGDTIKSKNKQNVSAGAKKRGRKVKDKGSKDKLPKEKGPNKRKATNLDEDEDDNSSNNENNNNNNKIRKTNVTPFEEFMSQKNTYCICRKSGDDKWMICCDFCDEWFHGECVNISESEEKLIIQYSCPQCTIDNKGKTSWKRKCRLPYCNQPAMLVSEERKEKKSIKFADKLKSSKYCSPEHGLQYFKGILPRISVWGGKKALLSALCNLDLKNPAADFKKLGFQPIDLNEDNKIKATDESKSHLIKTLENSIKLEENIINSNQEGIDLFKARSKFALDISELNKTISETMFSRNTKKEICGFDSRLTECMNQFKPDCLNEKIETEVVNDLEIPKTLCTNEKKKCLKHAGWPFLCQEDSAVNEKRYSINNQNNALDIFWMKKNLNKLSYTKEILKCLSE